MWTLQHLQLLVTDWLLTTRKEAWESAQTSDKSTASQTELIAFQQDLASFRKVAKSYNSVKSKVLNRKHCIQMGLDTIFSDLWLELRVGLKNCICQALSFGKPSCVNCKPKSKLILGEHATCTPAKMLHGDFPPRLYSYVHMSGVKFHLLDSWVNCVKIVKNVQVNENKMEFYTTICCPMVSVLDTNCPKDLLYTWLGNGPCSMVWG